MSLLDNLIDKDCWNKFYEYKTSLVSSGSFLKELRSYIDSGGYMNVYDEIMSGRPFPIPHKSVISKMSSEKKRTVYTYPDSENIFLKHLTYLLIRKYDHLFSNNLYSFRPGHSAKSAVLRLVKKNISGEKYSYKTDIHDYFNSVPVDGVLDRLHGAIYDDEMLYDFLRSLLTENRVIFDGKVIAEKKGIMAGTPLASFYANLYLSGLDRYFSENDIDYARYSDDIIVFADSENECREHAEYINEYLKSSGLVVNPAKEIYGTPDGGFVFLGFECKGDKIDIAPATVNKLKGKMRRKRDALKRWQKRNGYDGDKAARAFIRIFNHKLLDRPEDNELTWSYWFFPVINVTDRLGEIDHYAQDCVRYLVSGKHTKARYNVRYEDMKELDYKSLVHEYYNYEKMDEG